MKITAETFAPFSPCPEGIAAFKAVYPDGIAEWTREAQLAALQTDCRRWVGWAWGVGAVPAWSMSGANLYGANLYGADLNDAILPKGFQP